MTNTAANPTPSQIIKEFPLTFFRGIGQVMFQDSIWTGIFFTIGIFWGAYASHTPAVAWGMLLGTFVSTLAGYLMGLKDSNGSQGLWGFNGCLVGCALPTFLGNTIWMWLAIIFCSAMTTWVRSGLDNVWGKWNLSTFTFPFVLCTWFFLLAARAMHGMPPVEESAPAFPVEGSTALSLGFVDLVIYWLKGISQVFLINSWVTGAIFLVGLAVSSWRAALWCAVSSAVALLVIILWQGPGADISAGLYGFSAVLTGIALGATFCNYSWKAAVWAVLGVIATVFIQAAMNIFFAPIGLATLTGPFCIATWLFLLPAYPWFMPKSN